MYIKLRINKYKQSKLNSLYKSKHMPIKESFKLNKKH